MLHGEILSILHAVRLLLVPIAVAIAACGSAAPAAGGSTADRRTAPAVRDPMRTAVTFEFEERGAVLLWRGAGEPIEMGGLLIPHDGARRVDASWSDGVLFVNGTPRGLGGEEARTRRASMPTVRALELASLEGPPLDVASVRVRRVGTADGASNIEWLVVPPAGASSAHALPELRALRIESVGAEVAPSAWMPQLGAGVSYLDLAGIHLAADAPGALATSSGIEVLGLARVRVDGHPITGELDPVLRANPRLRDLDLAYAHVLDSTAQTLGTADALEALRIDHATISSDAWATLLRAPRLAALSAQGLTLDDSHVAALTAAPTLRAVDLRWSTVAATTLARLAAMTELVWLGLPDTTDETLAALANLPNLEVLCSPGATTPTDAGLAAIVATSSLRELIVGGAGITDASLDHLATLSNLVRLELIGTSVSQEGLSRLRARRSDLTVEARRE